MLIAHYVGSAKPGFLPWLGWHATVLVQKSPYGQCTHTEAIHALHDDGTVTIASSSIHDKGVRRKQTALTAGNWVITDVPQWDVRRSIDWFDAAIAKGMRYDMTGALATYLPGHEDDDKVFCTESVLAPFIKAAHYYGPAIGLSICLSLGTDVTDDFFQSKTLVN